MRRTRALVVAVHCLVVESCFSAGTARATGQDLFGVGARSQAMAQTGVAQSTGYAAAYINPALLGGQQFNAVTLGFRAASFDLHYRANETGREHDLESGVSLGLVAPLRFGGPLRDRVALGMSVYSPRRNVARAELWFPERPQFPLLSSQADALGLSLGLGISLPYNVELGVGTRWLAGLGGSVVASSDEQGDATYTTMNTELELSAAPVIGVAYQPSRNWSLGFVWRDQLKSALDVTVTLNDLGTLVLPPLHLAGMAQYEPEQYEAEAAYVGDVWSLVLGARYRLWSRFPGFVRQTVRCPAAATCGTEPPPAPNYENTLSPRAAFAFRLPLSARATAELRAGLGYEPSPAPEQVGVANQWDNARLIVSAGYGVRVESGYNAFSCDFAVQTQRLAERRHEKEPSVSSDNPGYPSAKTWGHIDVAVVELGVEF